MWRAAVAALALLAAGCSGFFLYPSEARLLHPVQFGLDYADVRLTAPDGSSLHGWHLRAPGTPRGTVLHLHGNSQNISAFLEAVQWLPAAGYDVLTIDYRGFGASEGTATLDHVHEDAQQALQYLLAQRGPWFVYGQSLGGSVAIATVAADPRREQISGVITEGAFATFSSIAREKLSESWTSWALQVPLSWFIPDTHAAARSVARLAPVPLLIVHGEKDPTVPPSHALRLYRAAREPRELWIVPGSGHVQTFTSTVENREILLAFLARAAARTAARASPAGLPASPTPKNN